MIIIEDNFFPDDEYQKLHQYYRLDDQLKYHPFLPKEEYDDETSKIVKFASRFFDFHRVIGCEIWTNKDRVTAIEHDDFDERYYRNNGGVKRYPACTMVFYPDVDESQPGGELCIRDGITIKPKSNRLVVFSPGILHSINPFSCRRISVVYNPWTYNPNP